MPRHVMLTMAFKKLYWYKNIDNFGTPAQIDNWSIKTFLEDKNGNIIPWSVIQFINPNGMYLISKLLSKKTPKVYYGQKNMQIIRICYNQFNK